MSSDESSSDNASPRTLSHFAISSRSAFQPSVPRSSFRIQPVPFANSSQSASSNPTTSGSAQAQNGAQDPNPPPQNPSGERSSSANNFTHLIRQRVSQNNFDIYWGVFQRYLNSVNTGSPAPPGSAFNNPEEGAGEQSENGYWLLEEDSNSDDDHQQSARTNSIDVNMQHSSGSYRRRPSRWIQLDPTNRDSSNAASQGSSTDRNQDPSTASQQTTSANSTTRATSDNAINGDDRLSPVSANSSRYEQPPLFPFRSMRENLRNRRSESLGRINVAVNQSG